MFHHNILHFLQSYLNLSGINFFSRLQCIVNFLPDVQHSKITSQPHAMREITCGPACGKQQREIPVLFYFVWDDLWCGAVVCCELNETDIDLWVLSTLSAS